MNAKITWGAGRGLVSGGRGGEEGSYIHQFQDQFFWDGVSGEVIHFVIVFTHLKRNSIF